MDQMPIEDIRHFVTVSDNLATADQPSEEQVAESREPGSRWSSTWENSYGSCDCRPHVRAVGWRLRRVHHRHAHQQTMGNEQEWLPVFFGMPRMLKELARKPEAGLLGAQSMGFVVVQYWRSFEASEAGILKRRWRALARVGGLQQAHGAQPGRRRHLA